MDNNQSFKLNEVILGFEKILDRYKYFYNKFLMDNSKLINTPIGQEIMKTIQNVVNNNSDNQFSKILTCVNVNNNDLLLNYNLDNFQNFIEENAKEIKIFNDPTLKSILDFADNYKWASQCLIVNIDTYINIFFKLLFNIENDTNLPKGFNDSPKTNFYERFPELNGKLDYEFTIYYELHAIRNNIVHNGMIVDKKLLDKLSIKDDTFIGNISMYLHNFNKVILYSLACLDIVVIVNDEILKNNKLMEEIKKRGLYQYLEKYRDYKERHPI
ncbi:MAG TPA: hypothetical protein DD621_01660 [Clostridiales bacterium]|nr:hypothetical protein [Clostridiales bacterium]